MFITVRELLRGRETFVVLFQLASRPEKVKNTFAFIVSVMLIRKLALYVSSGVSAVVSPVAFVKFIVKAVLTPPSELVNSPSF